MKTTMRFAELFDHIFFAAQFGYKKTNAEFYIQVERVLGLSGTQILLWDDGQDNLDVARGQGWNVELFESFEAFEQMLDRHLGQRTTD
jgi:FMN phosphatase YigB (HAD superfamily)